MTRVRPIRDRHFGRTAPSGVAGRRLAGRRGRVSAGGWAGITAWLAVLAILVQTIVPDFAMAAGNAARRNAEVATPHHHVLHRYHDGSAEPDTPAPADQHQHEELCAFCLALSTHGTPTNAGAGLTAPVCYSAALVPEQPGIRPPQLFLVGSKPRAPPAPDRSDRSAPVVVRAYGRFLFGVRHDHVHALALGARLLCLAASAHVGVGTATTSIPAA